MKIATIYFLLLLLLVATDAALPKLNSGDLTQSRKQPDQSFFGDNKRSNQGSDGLRLLSKMVGVNLRTRIFSPTLLMFNRSLVNHSDLIWITLG